MDVPAEHLLSCWIVEAARASVLAGRGEPEAARRAAERGALLARACEASGVGTRPDLAAGHAAWMQGVTGTQVETGVLGAFLLQRLGEYVAAHTAPLLPPDDHARIVELGAPDAEEAARRIARNGIPPAPPPEWPSAPEARAPGEVLARIGVVGDPHVGVEIAERILPVAVEDLNREGVDLTVVLGDLTQNGAAPLFARCRDILDRLDAPYLVTLGNHDVWGREGDAPAGSRWFAAAFGREPHGVAEVRGVRVVALNSADPTASPFPPFDLITGGFTDDPNEAVPGGTISPEAERLIAALGDGAPTLLTLHHPPHPYLGFPPLIFGLDEPSTRLLASLVRRTGAIGVLCGHTHRSALTELAGAPVLEVPSVKEWPFGYGVVEVAGRGWSFNLRPISDGGLVAKASAGASLLFRRYARGPDRARAFASGS